MKVDQTCSYAPDAARRLNIDAITNHRPGLDPHGDEMPVRTYYRHAKLPSAK